MDYTELKIEVRQRLLDELDVSYPVGEHMVVTRCPFCMDSSKNFNKGHFYIKLNIRNEEEPILYICQRCQESGMLTPSIMRTLGVNDLELNSSLMSNNNKIVKSSRKALGIKDNSFNFKVPLPDPNDPRNIHKLDYLNGRLGIDFSFQDWVKLKTVFSLGQFLRENEITSYPKAYTKQRLQLLHESYVGWLTVRNEFINFRNTLENSNKRYDKYPIFSLIENTRKFFTIPNEIDLLSTRTITLNVAEGVFDIVGVREHIYDGEMDRMLYAAVTGSGFTTVIKYFIQMGVIGNVDLNIFSDNNHGKEFYRPMIKELRPWLGNITLYHNTILDKKGKSDYGVPKDKIKLVKTRL